MNAPTEHEQLSIEGMPAADSASESTPHMIARVNAMAIKIAHPFIARNDIRYYLNGINIRPLEDDTVMIVATDGHRYVVAHDQNGYCEKEIIVSIKKDSLKSCTSKSTLDLMSNGAAFINDEHGLPQFVQPGNSLIEAEFPRIENVASIVGYTEGISGSTNPAYLKDALGIGQQFGSIRFFTKDADSPLLFVVGGMGDLEVFGGIMKMRDSFEQLPSWFPKPVPFDLMKTPSDPTSKQSSGEKEACDPLYSEAVRVVRKQKKASVLVIQRQLRIGYNRATRLIEQMESEGIVSAMRSDGTRKVLNTDPEPESS